VTVRSGDHTYALRNNNGSGEALHLSRKFPFGFGKHIQTFEWTRLMLHKLFSYNPVVPTQFLKEANKNEVDE
jgi:hypothetical protein